MSPRTKEQFEEIRKESRKQILDAALELFAENGYHATSISQIALKAKISKGLMYNYFKNKEDLLFNVIQNGVEILFELTPSFRENKPPEKQLEDIIRLSSHHLKENTEFWNLYMSLILQHDVRKKVSNLLEKIRIELVNAISELLKQMGSENPSIDAFTLGTQLDGIGLNYVAAPDSFPLDEITDNLVKMYCKKENKRKKK